MRTLLILLLPALLAAPKAARAAAPEGAPGHEAAEDARRTVPGGAGKGVRACHADIERFCRGVEPGEGRLGACMKKHRKRLSKKCLRWARHGGAAHVDEAFAELDQPAVRPPSAPPVREQTTAPSAPSPVREPVPAPK